MGKMPMAENGNEVEKLREMAQYNMGLISVKKKGKEVSLGKILNCSAVG